MDTKQNILLVVNADSVDNKGLVEKVLLHSYLYNLQISLLYILPDIHPYHYQVPPIFGADNIKELIPHVKKEREKARSAIKQLATELGISYDQCYLVSGNHNAEVKRFVRLLKPVKVVGYQAPLSELFKSSRVFRILRRLGKYLWVLIAGYRFRAKKPSGGMPLFVK